jgi:hypothetical protein
MTERWTDETLDRFAATVATAIAAGSERLERIEAIQESNARAIAANTERIGRFAEQLEELTAIACRFSLFIEISQPGF